LYSDVNAIDGRIWQVMTAEQKEIYIEGYWDGVIVGIGQGIRYAQNTRTPDKKLHIESYELFLTVHITQVINLIFESMLS